MPNSPAKPEATNAKADQKDQNQKGAADGGKETADERTQELNKDAGKDKGDRFTSTDTFANPAEKFLANTQTVVDGLGIERIVSPNTSGFVPAPMEATDEQKEAAKRFEQMFTAASKQRVGQLKAEIKDEDRALNNQADGGSQSSPAS